MRMNYRIDDIRAFCCATRTGKFHEAADQLFISPSALSRRIANIESAIGGQVFYRSTRHVRLTSLGCAFCEQLSPLLAQMDASFSQAAGMAKGDQGRVVFASVATLAYSALPDVLRQFHALHPQVFVSVKDGIATSIAGLVEQGHAEFGIATPMAFGSAMTEQAIGCYGYNAISAKNHPWAAKRRTCGWQALQGQAVISLNPLSSTRIQVDAQLRSAGIAPPWTMEVDQLSTMLRLVRDEGYLAVLPSLFNAKKHQLHAVALEAPSIQRHLFYIKRRDSSTSPQAKALAQLLCEAVGTAHPLSPLAGLSD